jgi:DNA-binding NarL/FixJ family response regulator
MDTPCKVLVLHEMPLLRAGIAEMLRGCTQLAVTPWDGAQPVPWRTGNFDVVIADYAQGLQCLADPALPAPRPRVLMVTHQCTEGEVRRAMALGVHGYLLLDCSVEALQRVVAGVARGARLFDELVSARLAASLVHASLTQREHEVLALLVQGCANKTIAQRLDIAVGTVKAHIKAILEKLHVSSRMQAAAVAVERGMLQVPLPAAPPPLGPAPERQRLHAASNGLQMA